MKPSAPNTIAAENCRPLYPPKFAFVIQFADDDAAAESCRGRVEHVMSGHSDRFENSTELFEFIGQVRREIAKRRVDSAPEVEPPVAPGKQTRSLRGEGR